MHALRLGLTLSIAVEVFAGAAAFAQSTTPQSPPLAANPFQIVVAPVIYAAPSSETPMKVEVGLSGPPAEDTSLLIRGLPREARLTQGLTDGAGTWAVPVSKLKQLAIVLPQTATGRVGIGLELITSTGSRLSQANTSLEITLPSFVKPDVELPPIKVQGQVSGATAADEVRPQAAAAPAVGVVRGFTATLPKAAEGPATASTGALQPPAPPAAAALPPTPPAGRVAAPSGAERDKLLQHMARGDQMLKEGNVGAARLFYERAASQGWAPAALALGATYDAAELSRMGVLGVVADPAKARAWYEKARDLGAPEAVARLGKLR